MGEAEREIGQRLVFDIAFELDECDATVTDRIEDTVDYADVCEQVALAAQERSYKTLERLCAAVAERLIDRFGAESVRVKAAKPEPPIPLPVEEVSVEVWKEAMTGLPRPRLERGRSARPTCAPRAPRSSAHGGRGRWRRRRSYETAPQGEVTDQPDFLNACLRIGPRSSREELLDACKAVERELGRAPGGVRHGPRPIDVDVLLLGDVQLRSERLTLPHPEVTSRRFVLEPLLELDPELDAARRHPPGGRADARGRPARGAGRALLTPRRLGGFGSRLLGDSRGGPGEGRGMQDVTRARKLPR